MNKTSRILQASLVVWLLSCDEPSLGTIQTSEEDSSGTTIVSVSGHPEAVPEWNLIEPGQVVVGSAAHPFIGQIGKAIWLPDGRIVVEDRQSDELHLFLSDGRHQRKLAGQGDGPGEFRDIGTLSVGAGDLLHVFDRRHARVSLIDPDLGFRYSVPIPSGPTGERPRRVWYLPSNRYLVYYQRDLERGGRGPVQRVAVEGTLSVLDVRGEPFAGPMTFPAGFSVSTQAVSIYAAFSNRPLVASSPDFIVYSDGANYELTVLDEMLGVDRRVRWLGREAPISMEELEEVRRVTEDWYSEAGGPDDPKILAEATLAILPENRPMFGGGFFDDLNRLWISRFEPGAPGWPEPRSWHVLDQRFRPIGRLTLSEGTALLAVSKDRVMGLAQDSLGLQRIISWEVEGSSG